MTTGPESNPVRKHVVYQGRVQGVFFRATSYELSQSFPVAGYVRNLPDGTVELEAEGDPAEVDRFLASIQQHFAANIRSADVSAIPPAGDERGFQIRY